MLKQTQLLQQIKVLSKSYLVIQIPEYLKWTKLQALVYDTIPPTTATIANVIGLEKLSANGVLGEYISLELFCCIS